jgi:hypothetical protein
MSEREWRLKGFDRYGEDEYDNPCDTYRMIHTHLDQTRYVEKKIDLIQDLVALMFSAMTLEQQVEVMEMCDGNWELVDE